MGVEIQNRQGGHISDTKRIHREHIYNRVHDFAERIIASGAPRIHSRKRQGNAERNLADLLQKRNPRFNVGVDTVFADIEAKDKEAVSKVVSIHIENQVEGVSHIIRTKKDK